MHFVLKPNVLNISFKHKSNYMSIGILNIENIYNEFEEKLKKIKIKQSGFIFVKHILYSHISFFLVAYLLVLSGVLINYGSEFRTAAVFGVTGLFIFSLILITGNFLYGYLSARRNFDLIDFSRNTGMNYPDIKDNISNPLSVYRDLNNTDNNFYSKELAEKGLQIIKDKYYRRDLTAHIPFNLIKRLSFRMIVAMIIIILSFAIFPGPLLSSLSKFLNYNYEYINDSVGILFEIEPGNAEVVKGGNLLISVKLKSTDESFRADTLTLYFQTYSHDGDLINTEQAELNPVSENHFVYTLENINNNLTYYAGYENVKSKDNFIELIDYPVVRNFRIKIFPPEYTGIPAFEIKENEGNILCPEGSLAEFSLTSNKKLSSAGIDLNRNYISFDVNGDSASGSFEVMTGGVYNFVLKDEEGGLNKEDRYYELKVIRDELPLIRITEPVQTDYYIQSGKEILVRSRISDDYGFSSLTIFFRKSNSNTVASGTFYTSLDIPLINKNAIEVEVPFLWDISFFRFISGEYLEYYLEVKDNAGKTSRSETRFIRYISPIGALKKLTSLIEDVKSNLKAILEDIKNFKREAYELEKDIQNSEELGINEKQRREFQEKIERLQSNLDAVQDKMGNTLDEMKQSNMLSDKTLEEYLKLQEQFNKINTPEFREMLKRILEALKKNDNRQLQEELKNLNFDEEAFKKQLEKLLELMKKIENLQKFGELTKELEEIAKEQSNLKEETEKADKENTVKMNELSDKQKSVQDKYNNWKEKLDKLLENLRNMNEDISPSDLEELKKKMNARNTESKMNKSSKELQKGDKESSENTQEEIMNDLEEFNKDMLDALDNAMNSDEKMQKVLNKLKEIKQSIDKLAKDQGDLTGKTKGTDPGNKSDINQRSGEQKGLGYELSQDINDFYNLSREGLDIKPELGKELGSAYNKMEKAGNELREGDKEEAIPNQEGAKESLEKSSEMLGDMISQLSKQSKDGKQGNSSRMSALMQKLAQMIKIQQGMSGQLEKLGQNGKSGQDGKGNQDIDEQKKDVIEKLKLQQEQNRKTLEELNMEIQKEMQKKGEKPLGNLDEIAKDMKKIEDDLSMYKIDEKTLERQNKILSRLLEFQLSQREKDFEQKRESKPGENIIRLSPPEVVISGPNSINALKDDYLRLRNEGFTDEYEKLIIKYLENIRK